MKRHVHDNRCKNHFHPMRIEKKETFQRNSMKKSLWWSIYSECNFISVAFLFFALFFFFTLFLSFMICTRKNDHSFVNCKQFYGMSLACLKSTNCLNENFENYSKKLCHFQTRKYRNAQIMGLASFRHWRWLNSTSVYKNHAFITVFQTNKQTNK